MFIHLEPTLVGEKILKKDEIKNYYYNMMPKKNYVDGYALQLPFFVYESQFLKNNI